MFSPLIFLCIQTITLWFIVIFLHRKKEHLTLAPLYSFLAVLTILTHNFSDLGFAITFNNLFFLISSVSFFTSLMLGVLIIYIFEGPKATRLALFIILLTSFVYIGIAFLLGLQVDTSKWFLFDQEHLVGYFWSISAIIVDVFFIAILWELLGRIKNIPVFVQIFLVFIGTFFIDTLIFVTGVFFNQPFYLSVLKGDLLVRTSLALIVTPFIGTYLKSKNYKQKTQKIWEILNFSSNLESKIKTMEEMITKQKELENELKKSEETYHLALEGANAGIWDWNIEKNQITYSEKFYNLLGFKEKEIKNTIEAFKQMIHPDDVEKTFSLIGACLKNKEFYSIEHRLKIGDGSYKWYLNSGITKFDSFDKPIRMVGSIIDINEKKVISDSYAEKVIELEKFNKIMIDREVKMTEMKEELKALQK